MIARVAHHGAVAVGGDLSPPSAKNVGFVPLSSPSALAARRRGEPTEIINNFSAVRHATVFEA